MNHVTLMSQASLILIGLVANLSIAGELLSVNFDQDAQGTYAQTKAKEEFELGGNKVLWLDGFAQGRAEIVNADSGHGNALRVTYPKGCYGTVAPHACAAQLRLQLAQGLHDTLWLQYRVKFESDFEFMRGGKIPGLCGSECNTGGKIPTGSDGWSARCMWREEGKAVQYLYYAGQLGTYGVDVPFHKADLSAAKFELGKWHTITEQVMLNQVGAQGGVAGGATNGVANGRVRTWFDGTLAADSSGYMFRTQDSMHINEFYFSTFHGGNDSTWAPTHDNHAQFDDFKISSQPLIDSTAISGVSKFKNDGIHVDVSDAIYNAHVVGNELKLGGSTLEPIELKVISTTGRTMLQAQLVPGQVTFRLPSGAGQNMVHLQAGSITRMIPLSRQ